MTARRNWTAKPFQMVPFKRTQRSSFPSGSVFNLLRPQRYHFGSFSHDVCRPGIHQFPVFLVLVCSFVGGLYLVLDGMSQCSFANVAGKMGTLCGPVSKGRTETVRGDVAQLVAANHHHKRQNKKQQDHKPTKEDVGAIQRKGLLYDLDGTTGEGNAMFFLGFHSLGGHRPHLVIQIELRWFGPQYLASSGGGENQELKCKSC